MFSLKEKRCSLSKQVCAGEEAPSHIPAPGVMTLQSADPPCKTGWTAAWGRKTVGTDIWPQVQPSAWEHRERQIEEVSLVRCREKRCFYSTLTKVFHIRRPLIVTHVWLKTSDSKVSVGLLQAPFFLNSSFDQRNQNLQPFTFSSSDKSKQACCQKIHK